MGTTALKAAERAIVLQKVESLMQVTRSVKETIALAWDEGIKDPDHLNAMVSRMVEGMRLSDFIIADAAGRIIAHTRKIRAKNQCSPINQQKPSYPISV